MRLYHFSDSECILHLMIAHSINSITILFICDVYSYDDDRDILYHAVTPIEGLERLYLLTKPPSVTWKVALPKAANPETDNMRQEVCWTVVTSEHFRVFYNVYPTNISEANNGNQTSPAEKSSKNVSTGATDCSYEQREVWIGKRKVHELVFPCSACSYDTGKIVNFFISQVYRAQSRFVFKFDDKKKLVPVALAEISPSIVKFDDHIITKPETCNPIHDEFYNMITSFAGESRKICDMAAAEKVRLCSLIMNNSIYRNKHRVRFIPSSNSNPECEMRKIKFGTAHKDVWAIPCVAVSAHDMDRKLFYLSDTTLFNRNSYFITKEGQPYYLDQVFHF